MKQLYYWIRLVLISVAMIIILPIFSIVSGIPLFTIRGNAVSLSSLPNLGMFLEDTNGEINMEFRYDIITESVIADSKISKDFYEEIIQRQKIVLDRDDPCGTNDFVRLMRVLKYFDRRSSLEISRCINEAIRQKTENALIKQSSYSLIKLEAEGRRAAQLFFFKANNDQDSDEGLFVLYA